MHDILYFTACLMIKKEADKRSIRQQYMEGVVRTAFTTRTLAGMSGIEFYADLEKESGKGRVKFLVRPGERLRNGHWHAMNISDEEAQELNRWLEEGATGTH